MLGETPPHQRHNPALASRPMMRLLAIAAAIGLGLYALQTGGLPQISGGGGSSSGKFSGYTGAVGHAISPLTGD